MNLAVWGLIFDIMGVSILTLTTMISSWHGRRENLNFGIKEDIGGIVGSLVH